MNKLSVLPASIFIRFLVVFIIALLAFGLITVNVSIEFVNAISILVLLCFVLAPLLQLTVTNFYDSFFWLLIVNSVLSVYCLALYMSSLNNFLLIIFPMFLSSSIFLIQYRKIISFRSAISIILFFLSVPSIYSSISSDLVTIDRNLAYIFYSFFLPLIFYLGIREIKDFTQSQNIICFTFIITIIISLVLVPIELLARGLSYSSISSIEIAGRSYSLLAALIIIAPIFFDWISKQSKFLKLVFLFLILLSILISFSRGVFIFCLLALIPVLIINGIKRPKILVFSFLIILLLLLTVLFFRENEVIAEIIRFWSVRLNIYDNITGIYSFDISSILSSSGRLDLWKNADYWFSQNMLFGYGIGSTPELLVESTGIRFGFGGMHNQWLTILVERGIIGFLALIVLWLMYIYKILQLSKEKLFYMYCFFLYFAYAHSTGIELLVLSSKDFNSHTLIYFLMMLAHIENMIEKKR